MNEPTDREDPQASMTLLQRLAAEPAACCPTLDPLTAKPYQPQQTSIHAYQRVMRNEYKKPIVMPPERITTLYPPPKPITASESSNLGRYLLGQFTYPTIAAVPVDSDVETSLSEDMEMLSVYSVDMDADVPTSTGVAETMSAPVVIEDLRTASTRDRRSSHQTQAELKVVKAVKRASLTRRHSPRLDRIQAIDYRAFFRVSKERLGQVAKPIRRRSSRLGMRSSRRRRGPSLAEVHMN